MLSGIPIASINKGRSEKKALIRPKNKKFIRLKSTHQRYADVLKELGFLPNFSSPEKLEEKPISEKAIFLTGLKKTKWGKF